MHKLFTAIAAMAIISTPALAERTVSGHVTDNYKEVINRIPYNVEICTNVNVPGDKTGDTLKGAIIGGVIGNNVTKNVDNGGAIGALIGGLFGHNSSNATGGTRRQCSVETRYNEEYQTVYADSVITFELDGQRYSVRFAK
jgi:uncharacterized protein YcfJ|tara:strand:- start:276 stop:698 length:423 start_codon:yes stop_codon:yes gene_type:complete